MEEKEVGAEIGDPEKQLLPVEGEYAPTRKVWE